jgi:hypothetical protein
MQLEILISRGVSDVVRDEPGRASGRAMWALVTSMLSVWLTSSMRAPRGPSA